MVKYSLLCSFPVRTQTVKANAVLRSAVKLPHFQFLYNLNCSWKHFRRLRSHLKCSFVTAECFHAGLSFLEFFLMAALHLLSLILRTALFIDWSPSCCVTGSLRKHNTTSCVFPRGLNFCLFLDKSCESACLLFAFYVNYWSISDEADRIWCLEA